MKSIPEELERMIKEEQDARREEEERRRNKPSTALQGLRKNRKGKNKMSKLSRKKNR